MGRRAIYKLEHHYGAILDMYTVRGYSLREIGRKFGAPPEAIRRILKKYGHPTRSRSDAMVLWHERNSEKS